MFGAGMKLSNAMTPSTMLMNRHFSTRCETHGKVGARLKGARMPIQTRLNDKVNAPGMTMVMEMKWA